MTIVTLILLGVLGAGIIWSDATPTPKLALDLEGGTSIILEPQVSEDTTISKEQLDQAVAIIRQRVDSTGVSEAEITTQGDRNIVVNLPGNPDEETRNLVRSSAQLVFRRVALVGDPRSQAQIDEEQQGQNGGDPSEGLTDEERQRLEDLTGGSQDAPTGGGAVVNSSSSDETGADEPGAGNGSADEPANAGGNAPAPSESPAGETPAGESPAPTQAGEGQGEDTQVTDSTPRPLFDPEQDTAEWQTQEIINQYTELDCTNPENRTGGVQQPADEPVVSCAQDGSAKYVLGPVELSGDHLTDATFGYAAGANGVQTNQPAVNLEFDDTGREIFKQITSAITGLQQPYNQFAISLDGLVLSAPTSNAVITDGRAEISGNFTLDEAQTLANQLKNGSLPISFQVQSEEQISPTLGANYLNIGILTGLVGLLLVVVYSLLQYRVLGLVTVSSLVVVGVLTYLLLLIASWRYGYRLSLAGVAGIIIGIGMAADSFIVYFERVRDELRSGRNLLSAVEVGWDRAKRTIWASKSVNMLAAVILYILAVGSVRGFAFTLGLAVIVDILVVFLFTHPMLQLLARTKFFGQGHPMSGMDPRLLGVKPAAYRGALGIDLDNKDKSPEAQRRDKARARKLGLDDDTETIAGRRAKRRAEAKNSTSSEESTGSSRTATATTTALADGSSETAEVTEADDTTTKDTAADSEDSESGTAASTESADSAVTKKTKSSRRKRGSDTPSTGGTIAERKAAAKRAAAADEEKGAEK
ncbi:MULTISPECIES: protein translocase subunit SecD [unclassified Brevibacterium]|uniref:protein translocase subunit SecD n=1 Tax=unclassified Brevibacterium TaxID=2614124 RepID=UPI0010F76282|nr:MULTISPECIES: protein translocase subunit SecD [unclassified Brevibacterium]MCM1012562.1 protein translocase subunit SecD [Brevibacterium sp. XM4083]